jgi:hypothetical protein
MTPKTCLPFLLLAALFGCTTQQKKEETEVDRLWRAGFGYNNPNPQRKKEGLPAVDFDGSVHRD